MGQNLNQILNRHFIELIYHINKKWMEKDRVSKNMIMNENKIFFGFFLL